MSKDRWQILSDPHPAAELPGTVRYYRTASFSEWQKWAVCSTGERNTLLLRKTMECERWVTGHESSTPPNSDMHNEAVIPIRGHKRAAAIRMHSRSETA